MCVCVCVLMCALTVKSSEMMPEGGRDRLAPLFYHPVFADGERRASLGQLNIMDAAPGAHAAPSE